MAIKVRQLDSNNDRTFGQNKANYIINDDAISQNVTTRLKSFKNDFFLNIDDHIDWFSILGQKKNEKIIIDEITRVTYATDGVVSVDKVEVTALINRDATIVLEITTINSTTLQLNLTVGV